MVTHLFQESWEMKEVYDELSQSYKSLYPSGRMERSIKGVERALVEMKGKISSLMEGRIKDENPAWRFYAVRYLGFTGDPGTIPIILEALKVEDDSLVGREMVRALSGIRSSEVTDTLLSLLKTHNLIDVRLEVVKAMGDFPRADVTEALLGILKDENPIFRMWAVISLTKLKDPLAIPGLLESLEDEGVRINAVRVPGERWETIGQVVS